MTLKKTMLVGASCLSLMALSSPQEASATPVFARQTSQSCAACHFQRFPMLNAYGRSFKANGYTTVGKQGTIEDTNLSTPAILNAGLVSKFRYQKTNGTADTELNAGEFQVPDEATLFVGGKVAKNIGFQAEIGLTTTASMLGFKVPFVFPANDFTFSAIPFYSDAQGAAYGFELLNTGALRFSRTFENRTEASAQQYIGAAHKTTGVALVALHKYGYISYTPYLVKDVLTDGIAFSSGRPLSYIRGVVTPEKVGNWDLAAGAQIWTGSSEEGTASAPTRNHASAWAIDAQAQGKAGDMPLGVYVAYGSAAASKAGETANFYNASTVASKNALTIATELGIVPNRLGIGVAYRNANSGAGAADNDNALTLGANYQIARNMVFQLNHSFYSGDIKTDAVGKQLTTAMFYSAF
ncbi:hypothetical protein [Chlorobium ferrooxidans]|uniref:Uncharacterized protein n=1 Tax=Chlorobium ferrooxidans DSM 13031 TaxID=377431 RepID=Q0YNZ7_9CHLB|nr:hypothetical protein [Chlorobium ferrooxidans]EAT58010.1 hypothetical protein CferDRAFT_0017 [Chlorobium ferrooxidans DSM 13031]